MKKGFTLAEVLITLGIIGVVAALTLPSLINNIQDKQFKAAWKKEYSVLSQAIRLADEERGDNYVYAGDYTDESTELCRLHKYLNVLKSGIKCTDDFVYVSKNNNITWHANSGGWHNKKGDIVNINGIFLLSVLYLADGAWVGIISPYTYVVDVNGKKKPNIVGKDIFYFGRIANKAVFFGDSSYWAGSDTWFINSSLNTDSTTVTVLNYKDDCETGTGWGCSPLYILE